MSPMSPEPPHRPSFREAVRFWFKLGCLSFGGLAGQIALMHREVVEQRRWVGEAQFLHALNFCLLLPGPEAQQLATYLGWLLHRTRGALAAGILFVLPSAILLWALSWAYVAGGHLWWVRGLFDGLKPAVLALVAAAVVRLAGKSLRERWHWGLAVAAFVALRAGVPFPLLVVGAGAIGWAAARWWRKSAPPEPAAASPSDSAPAPSAEMPAATLGRAVRVSALCLASWWLPLLAVGAWLGWGSVPFQQALFFSKAALVTFGGAYAVLPYVGQQAVEHYGWLTASQMVDGLGLAETTPGPLIMVLQFVGFLGGWQHPGSLSPWAAASLCAGVTTWSTFAPSFYWIFLGAPYVERLRENVALRGALAALGAAVVGIILSLALWFAGQVVLPGGRFDPWAALAAVLAFVALHRWKWDVLTVIGLAALLGLVRMSLGAA
ncbi:MAG: chromate efflux transporter [Verrucomicrobia bacterium]|nr:chromate efflux transporter [Verrucomicrobiota bacterium]